MCILIIVGWILSTMGVVPPFIWILYGVWVVSWLVQCMIAFAKMVSD